MPSDAAPDLPTPVAPAAASPWTRVRRGVGYALLAISTVTWFGGLLAAPFLPLPVAKRAAIGGAGILIGEIAFWAAVPFLGKELVMLFRRWLNPLRWLRRRKPSAETGGETSAEGDAPSPGPEA